LSSTGASSRELLLEKLLSRVAERRFFMSLMGMAPYREGPTLTAAQCNKKGPGFIFLGRNTLLLSF